ncbi:hypothetical protein [Streptomyces sp. NBC_00344]|uniref:hypothetical protein n=1 Tax=Streptomyces sp. NBC_00344 TaxID=2975720 RepID=UPI002E1BF945
MRRRTAALLAATVTAVTLAGAVGCDAVNKAVDCVQTADTVAGNVNNLQQAVSNIGNDPGQVDQALDNIAKNLGKLGDKTGDTDVSKAVDDLNTAVDNVRKSVDSGDRTPDISPVRDAAGELTKVCTS